MAEAVIDAIISKGLIERARLPQVPPVLFAPKEDETVRFDIDNPKIELSDNPRCLSYSENGEIHWLVGRCNIFYDFQH